MNKFLTIIEKVGIDNILHFLCGWLIASLGLPFGMTATLITFVVAVFSGLCKEIYDQVSYGGFDAKEWTVTAFGATFPLLYISIINLV